MECSIISSDSTFREETWLRPNRRALVWGMVPPGAIVLGAGAAALGWGQGPTAGRLVAALLAAGAAAVLGALLWQLRLPRIGCRGGQLRFYLRAAGAYDVPIEAVECFFIGQGPTLRPHPQYPNEQTVTVVVRLAENAKPWHEREVKPSIGAWCDGYITIRGTWCEPLDGEVVNGLNRRLAARHRAQKELR